MTDLAPTAVAFGKVILLGEHSVVYGYPALAVGLPQGLELTATRSPHTASPNQLRIAAWDVDVELSEREEHPVALAASRVLDACGGPLRGWTITGETCLPAGAGLGSSAALCVALARLALPDAAVEDVIEASLAGERVFHGEPSGLDNTVAARGGLLRFVRGEGAEEVRSKTPLPLWILPSGVGRSSGLEVANVGARYDRFPSLLRPVMDALGAAVALGAEAIVAGDHVRLGEIMTVSHELLSGLGVGHSALDHLVKLARSHGSVGAKLTGAGGGGCVLALPPSDPEGMRAACAAIGISPLEV